jgi:hypothetical protein
MTSRADGAAHEGPLAARPVLRVLIGLGRLAVEQIGHTVDLVAGRQQRLAPGKTHASPPGKGRRAFVGALASLPAWRAAANDSAPARFARRVGAALERARPTSALVGLLASARTRAARAVARLAMLGEEEERRDRALASAAVEEIFDATCARLAESEPLRRLVREQTTGVTAAALAAVREWCARADDAVERALSWLPDRIRRRLRRRPRLLPAESAS